LLTQISNVKPKLESNRSRESGPWRDSEFANASLLCDFAIPVFISSGGFRLAGMTNFFDAWGGLIRGALCHYDSLAATGCVIMAQFPSSHEQSAEA
jgi:hypothetical protein